MSKAPYTKLEVLRNLLELIQEREALIIIGLNNKELENKISLHSQHLGIGVNGRFWKSIKHLGYGVFRGETPNGKFGFCGGGAMSHRHFKDKSYISYSRLTTDNNEVLKDLNYPFAEVEQGLKQEIAKLS